MGINKRNARTDRRARPNATKWGYHVVVGVKRTVRLKAMSGALPGTGNYYFDVLSVTWQYRSSDCVH